MVLHVHSWTLKSVTKSDLSRLDLEFRFKNYCQFKLLFYISFYNFNIWKTNIQTLKWA